MQTIPHINYQVMMEFQDMLGNKWRGTLSWSQVGSTLTVKEVDGNPSIQMYLLLNLTNRLV